MLCCASLPVGASALLGFCDLLRFCASRLLRFIALLRFAASAVYCASALLGFCGLLRFCASALLGFCGLLRFCASALLGFCGLLRFCASRLRRLTHPGCNPNPLAMRKSVTFLLRVAGLCVVRQETKGNPTVLRSESLSPKEAAPTSTMLMDKTLHQAS